MTDNSNLMENWREPRNTTKIPPQQADNINDLILKSQKLEKTLDPELVKLWKESLVKVVFEINLLRESIGLKIIQVPNIIFYKADDNRQAGVSTVFDYKGKKIIPNGRILIVNLQNLQFLTSDNPRIITHILAHEMIHFADSVRIFSYKFSERQFSERQFSGLNLGKLMFKNSKTEYLEEKITLSEQELKK